MNREEILAKELAAAYEREAARERQQREADLIAERRRIEDALRREADLRHEQLSRLSQIFSSSVERY